MIYGLIADFHGSDKLKDLERTSTYQKMDVRIFLGDYDQTRTIHQAIDLEKKCKKEGKKVIKVPGNHDHAILTNLGINSGTLEKQNKTDYELHGELKNDIIAYKYIEDLVNSENTQQIFLDKDKFGEIYQTVIIHGAYNGDLSSFPDCPDKLKDLWYRLIWKKDYEKNFGNMSKKGDKIMLRGHDHHPVYYYKDSIDGIVQCNPLGAKFVHKLFPDRKYIINPGAFFDGYFATIDTRKVEVPLLEYHRL